MSGTNDMREASAGPAPKAGPRAWIGLAVIALPCLLYSMDLTVLHLAIPALTRDLEPSSAQLLWIIDIYGFLVAGTLIIAGTLGDRIGRRKLLLIGAAAFAVASVAAAFSTSAEMLIATRALLGLAGATVAPSTLSLIRNMFLDPQQRTVAISIWITSYSLGGAVGPLIGGILLEYFWWGSVFLISVPVMGLLLAIGPSLLPEYKDPNAGRPDLASATLSLTAVLSMIFGLKQIAQDGVSLLPLLTILAGVALGVVFVRRQLVLADPLIDLRLFRVPAFSASLATYGLTILIMFGGFLFLPQYLQLVLGLSPFDAGLWTLPWALAFIVGAIATPKLARSVRPARLMSAGLALSAIGYWMIAGFDTDTSFVTFGAASFILSIGVAPVFTLTTDLIIGSAPPERAGAASAISETSAEFGGALGIAVFGSIGVAVYRAWMADAVPAGLTDDSLRAATATIGGAIEVAGQIGGAAGDALRDAARTAFVRGLRIGGWISVVGSLVMAVFAATSLRGIRGSSEHGEPASQPGPSPEPEGATG
jgi:DHA2 family multidrug resistance protein-like MFS transporter